VKRFLRTSVNGKLKRRFKPEKGFTLIEMLITLSMIGFVIAAVYSFYLTGLKGWERSTEQVEYQQSARIALDKIVHELTAAKAVSIKKQGKEIRFNIHGDTRTFRFRLAGPQLVFDVYPPSSHYYTVVALGITDLYFSKDEHNLITVKVGAGSFDPKSGEPIRTALYLTSAVLPRNLPVEIIPAVNSSGETGPEDENQ
jgi:prepilin-type N-terminal cleavage/methylation domain-containing protein